MKKNKQNYLVNCFPELCKEWHPTKNIYLTPKNVTRGSHKKVWWKCKNSKCNYEWEDIIYNRVAGAKCHACSGRVVTKNNCLENNYPEISKEWHPIKNENLLPKDVSYGSNKNIWWICNKCKYEWKVRICERTRGRGCPACAGHIITKNNCLSTLFPELCKEWHPTKNKNLTTQNITKGSRIYIWWKCSKCSFEWEAVVYHRTYSHSGCPICSGNFVTNENCLYTNYPKIAKEWHSTKNGNLIPEKITQHSGIKVWWICSKCSHEWKTCPGSRTGKNKSGCPKCAKSRISKSGSLWLDGLKIPIENREFYIKIGKKKFYVDGYDPKTKTIYEYFGNYWHGNPEYYNPNNKHPVCKKTFGDLYKQTMDKIKLFEENGYKIIYKWGD